MRRSEGYLMGYRAACERILVEGEVLSAFEARQLVERMAEEARQLQQVETVDVEGVPMQGPGRLS